jgi:magnesium-transporting ATPase (P-type)
MRAQTTRPVVLTSTVLVKRNGEVTECVLRELCYHADTTGPHRMSSSVLVPGDIVQIRLGNKLPTDVCILDATSDFKIDKSILAGVYDHVALIASI